MSPALATASWEPSRSPFLSGPGFPCLEAENANACFGPQAAWVQGDYCMYTWPTSQSLPRNLPAGLPSGSVVKNPPAVQEMQVQSLGWEDAPEKETATRSSVLSWEIPWTEAPGGLQFMESQEST